MRAMRALSQSILSTGINLPSQLDLARWQGKTMENGEHAKECKMQQKIKKVNLSPMTPCHTCKDSASESKTVVSQPSLCNSCKNLKAVALLHFRFCEVPSIRSNLCNVFLVVCRGHYGLSGVLAFNSLGSLPFPKKTMSRTLILLELVSSKELDWSPFAGRICS